MNKKRFTIIVCLVTILMAACATETITPQIIYVYEPTKPEEQVCSVRFPDCHSWKDVSQYSGQQTCLIGRIERKLFVTDINDPNLSTWDIFFDPQSKMMPADRAEIVDSNTASSIYAQTTGLVVLVATSGLRPPDEDNCVAVFGEVYNNTSSPSRLMMDSIGNPNNPTVIFQKCACGN